MYWPSIVTCFTQATAAGEADHDVPQLEWPRTLSITTIGESLVADEHEDAERSEVSAESASKRSRSSLKSVLAVLCDGMRPVVVRGWSL